MKKLYSPLISAKKPAREYRICEESRHKCRDDEAISIVQVTTEIVSLRSQICKLKLRASIVSLWLLSMVIATICASIIPMKSWAKSPKTYHDIEIPPLVWSLPQFQEFTLSNGIAGLVVEDHEVPLVDFYLSFPSPFDPADKVGLAEMTAWTLRNGGSVNLPADSLNELIEFKAASISISAGQEKLSISGDCMSDDLDLMMGIVAELIDKPAYPDDKIDMKRNTMLESIRRSNDNPRGIAYREFFKLVYPDHPWGLESSVATVNSLSRADLGEFHSSVFQSRNAVFGVSGDINASETERLFEKHFGHLIENEHKIAELPAVNEAAEPAIYYAFKEVNQAYVVLGHQSVSYSHPLRHASVIMNYILGGGGFQSILMKKIRVDEGLAYSVWSGYTTPVPVVGRFISSASTRLDQAGRTMTMMNEVIEAYHQNGPTQDQFDFAVKAYRNSYVWKYESADQILSRLVYLKWRGLPLDTPQKDLEAFQRLTLEDVKQAAAELLHPEKLITVVVGDKDKLDKPLEDFGEVIEIDLSVE